MARAIFKYLGRFPRKWTIGISYDRDSDGTEGTTFGGTRIEFELGTRVKPDYLAHDWVLAHEMIHLVFPDLDDRYRWMEEGLAVYVGNLARERDGLLLEQDFWSEFLDRMPEGLPKAGDQDWIALIPGEELIGAVPCSGFWRTLKSIENAQPEKRSPHSPGHPC